MDYSEITRKVTFPEEPLDSRDRKLIQTISGEGKEGIGFNKLVERAKPFASRGTVAVRVERLVRLGYLERRGGERGQGKERPTRVTFKCYSLMMSAGKAKEVAARLHSQLRSMQSAQSLGEKDLRGWWAEFRESYNSLFGMVGTIAVFYGTSAAGDLFLPLIVEDYKALSTEFMGTVRARPALLRSLREIIENQAASKGVDLEEIRKRTRDELLDYAVYRFRDWEPEGGA